MKKYIVGFVVGAVFSFVVICILNKDSASNIYVTAAHLPHDQITGYTFMYEDTGTDTAYYVKSDIQHKLPRFDTKVKFINNAGKVAGYLSNYGFIVDVDNESDIYHGMSGARVTDIFGRELGFISSYKDGKLFCVSTR